MPRPGPKPYDCARRAWHSDRHHPIRGSLIQELFRIVNEVHSSATRKNREWQEKTPIVVLQAEEIMYSKANSEAEYVDLSTLWDRANDAINIIIRRDEASESGELLQPCIEAALQLGCTPIRASRSERNISSRCYLNPNKTDLETKLPSSELLAPSKNLEPPVPSSCSVYPLYYGSQSHLGHPTSIPPAPMAEKEDLMEEDESGCDLTLHLGGALAARNDESTRKVKKDEPTSFSPKWIQEEGQNSDAELNLRKRKAGASHPLEDMLSFSPLKIPFQQLNMD